MEQESNTIEAVHQIRLCSLGELRGRCAHLFGEHAREIEAHRGDKADPDWDMYEKASGLGDLMTILAEEADAADRNVWRVTGYLTAFVCPHIHFYGRTFSQLDAMFVIPSRRRRGLCEEMLQVWREEAQRRGASELLMAAKPGSNFERLLQSEPQFAVEEIIYREEL